jgi:hypothetical protein
MEVPAFAVTRAAEDYLGHEGHRVVNQRLVVAAPLQRSCADFDRQPC